MPNQVSLFVSHHNPGHVSPQMNRRSSLVPLQYTQVSTWVSQLNSWPISPPTGSQDFHLTSRQTPKLRSLHPDHVSAQYRSLHLRFTSISVMSHLHSDPQNCISAASEHHLKPMQVSTCVPHLDPGPQNCIPAPSRHHTYIYKHPGFKMFISPPFRLHLSPIQVIRFSSQLHQDDVSAPSRSCRLNFSPFEVPS